ncbi:AmmeMemoRadiSam system protein A [uncultured Desulfovibrio sp.]|uniref:AmmeMemoRadiSam system protein A n=1 Tax=uncultured Desulfovibrio sp. TaxID=167968 RepID=UPI0026017464|nr:AmmeMemoRadiSam system protein A [uncultured Desulfovibrio sp.]
MSLSFVVYPEEQDFLGRTAELSIASTLAGRQLPQAPAPSETIKNTILHESLGSFVTLHRKHALRGCIGTVIGREPLYQNVWRMAHAAAFEDPRFSPVTQPEWPDISLEISVLGPLTLCPGPDAIEIGKHGLLLTHGHRSGLFLPQVPVEQGWNLAEYLENLCRKAGLPPRSWQAEDAALYWYEAFVFPAKQVQD